MIHLFAFIGIVVALAVLVFVAVVVLLAISLWKIFKKANIPGWAALIPFYNKVKILEITNEPLWWILLGLIPIVNVFIIVAVVHRLAVVFGKGWGFTIGMIFLPFIFLPILAFGKAQYMNTYPAAAPMSEATKWAFIAALVFFVIVPFWGRGASPSHRPSLSIIQSSQDGTASYATDGQYVYANDYLVLGANPRTFRLIGSDYAIDHNLIYYTGEIVQGADPATFVAEWGTTTASRSGGVVDYDAKDAKNFYYNGEVVQ